MSGYCRRLPVYLLLDCSESMAGSAIEEVDKGINLITTSLTINPHAVETVWLSVILFSRDAKQVVPLTEVPKFKPPKLLVRTGTALGSALALLIDSIRKDVIKTTESTKGDWKPLVFLFSDGYPTDDWEEAAAQLKSQRKPSIASICAIGCGPDADMQILKCITDQVYIMKGMDSQAWDEVFNWVTDSLAKSSKVTIPDDENGTGQFRSPPAILEPPPAVVEPRITEPRQVFLHGICSRDGQPYLMRYAKEPHEERYRAVCSHRLEFLEEDAEGFMPPINTTLLDGVPPCPYCENSGFLKCECNSLICWSGETGIEVICPKCRKQSLVESDGSDPSFDVDQTIG